MSMRNAMPAAKEAQKLGSLPPPAVAAKVVVGVLAVFAVVCLYQNGHQPHSWANRPKITFGHHSWKKKYPDCIATPFSSRKYPFHGAKRRQTIATYTFAV